MKKTLMTIIMLFVLAISSEVMAQKSKPGNPDYQTAIGAKFYPFGVSLRTRLSGYHSKLEFLGYFNDGFRLTGLYEYFGKLNEQGNLKWYIGGGAHAGFADNGNNKVKLGVDGVLGLDYKFLNLPLDISLDWQPGLGIGDDDAFTNWGGLGVRFAF